MSDPENYTVGWICAIRTEYVAAQAFLDEKHERPENVSPRDNNDHTLGRIGKHNVVIAVLPYGGYGISSATGVAKDMLNSFPNVRIGLMVGIGGGAPNRKHDIRLGDIVVSAPSDGKGGVFQILKPAADSPANGDKWTYGRKPRLRQKYKRPDPRSDRLYQSEVIHPPTDEANCAAVCGDSLSNLILRPKRTENEDNPAIHYGLIASANQLMKNALVRDTLAAERDVLCFEMEAAGLINHFPCLVIRGICDYSDTHKNKEWQGYAAMTAAAYTKDLLYRIAPNRVEAERKINDILSSVEKDVKEIRDDVHEARNTIKDLGFKQSSAIIADLDNTLSSQPRLYFYFDFNDTSKQTFESMIRSLIIQLSCKNEDMWKEIHSLFSSCEDGRRQPTRDSLCKVLLQMIDQVKEVWIVLDALDESKEEKAPLRENLLSWMKDLLNSEQRNVHLLVTSRPEQDITSRVSKFADKNDIVPIQSNLITADIQAYVHTRVGEDKGFKRWRARTDVQEEIEIRLMEKAGGMFRWAACQLDTLADCLDYNELRDALTSLPETLYETIPQFLAFSGRPLRIAEAVDAIVVKPTGVPYFDTKSRMPDPQEISRYCSSLVVLVSKKGHWHDEGDDEDDDEDDGSNKDDKDMEL
ncbi:purine and uridine phosphorylase [Zopfia rhizophila CBS 207.26]|uniref:Purine and uridine phosphorylase n=1 Tax=Zopfia rhizophila CBS 207.26 TaxID=1314779 RepID=A0A6A6DZV9_9PEZI|nr:purine and uridine phosphorylase [Zopfia rhizophila CBS 207.26]